MTPKIDHSIGFMLNHAGRRMTQLLTSYYEPYEITTEQWSVLNRLAEEDGINQKLLAIRAEKDQTNMTRILDQLERKGLVERSANAEDRRSFLIHITTQGRALNDILLPIEKKVIDSLLQGFSEEQEANLRKLLSQLTNRANELIKNMEETQ
ncbi:MarR family winged helix-turn-helix transcriptional regulator [Paenibacillus sp. N3.4]|uniref:MarR family winged helix-turn-helix transcriptional regulator n=1 Tax=Paenibacillus sp. N3.4 TaxID=2603222 RepID=UPI0011CA6A9A|nr:MarR family transcriptional regulator [Paenibacillus sp. N3.4]TXK78371.1 MarR family transcriptional regulator [Paenibacillus sp. N3.4]